MTNIQPFSPQSSAQPSAQSSEEPTTKIILKPAITGVSPRSLTASGIGATKGLDGVGNLLNILPKKDEKSEQKERYEKINEGIKNLPGDRRKGPEWKALKDNFWPLIRHLSKYQHGRTETKPLPLGQTDLHLAAAEEALAALQPFDYANKDSQKKLCELVKKYGEASNDMEKAKLEKEMKQMSCPLTISQIIHARNAPGLNAFEKIELKDDGNKDLFVKGADLTACTLLVEKKDGKVLGYHRYPSAENDPRGRALDALFTEPWTVSGKTTHTGGMHPKSIDNNMSTHILGPKKFDRADTVVFFNAGVILHFNSDDPYSFKIDCIKFP